MVLHAEKVNWNVETFLFCQNLVHSVVVVFVPAPDVGFEQLGREIFTNYEA